MIIEDINWDPEKEFNKFVNHLFHLQGSRETKKMFREHNLKLKDIPDELLLRINPILRATKNYYKIDFQESIAIVNIWMPFILEKQKEFK